MKFEFTKESGIKVEKKPFTSLKQREKPVRSSQFLTTCKKCAKYYRPFELYVEDVSKDTK